MFARHCIDIEEEKNGHFGDLIFCVKNQKRLKKSVLNHNSLLQTKTVHFTDRLNIKYWLPGITIVVSGTRQPVKVFYRKIKIELDGLNCGPLGLLRLLLAEVKIKY